MDILDTPMATILATEQAEENQQWLTPIFKDLSDGVIIVDVEGRITYVNPVAAKVLREQIEAAQGKSVVEVLDFDNKEATATLTDLLSQALKNGQVVSFPHTMVPLSLQKSKQLLTAGQLAPIKNAQGHVSGVVLIFQNKALSATISTPESQNLAQALSDIAKTFNASSSLNNILSQILATIHEIIPYDIGNIILINEGQARVAKSYGFTKNGLKSPSRKSFPTTQMPILRRLITTVQPLLIPNSLANPVGIVFPDAPWMESSLGVPIQINQKVVGCILLACATPNCFTLVQVQQLQAFAEQAGIVISNAHLRDEIYKQLETQNALQLENVRLFEETRQWAKKLEVLRRVSQELTSLRDLDELLYLIAERAIQLLDGDAGSMYLYRAEQNLLERVITIPTDNLLGKSVLHLGEGLAGRVWQTREPVIINDAYTGSVVSSLLPDLLAGPALGMPIQGIDGFLGVLNISSAAPEKHFNAQDVELLSQFTQQAEICLQNVRLFEAERQARKQAEILREETRQNLIQISRLYELSTEIVSTLSVQDTANLVVEKIVQATNAHSAVINLLDGQGNLQLTTETEEPPPRPMGTTMTIFRTGQPIAINDTNHEPEVLHPDLLTKGLRASIGLPLKVGEHNIGVLFVRHLKPRQFSWREIETLFIFANQAAVAIQNARLYEQVQQHATDLEVRVAERTFELQVLYELAQALEQATHLSDVIRLILLHLYQAIPHDVAASLLVNDKLQGLFIVQSQQPLSATLETHLQEIMCSALEQMRSISLNEMTLDIRRIQAKSSAHAGPPVENLESLMQALVVIDKQPIGILLVASERPDQFRPEHANLLRTMADQAAESIQRLQSLLEAEHHRLENLVAHLPDGVILLDDDYRIVLANPVARDLFLGLISTESGNKLTRLGLHPIETIVASNALNSPFEVEETSIPYRLFEVTPKPIAVGPEAGGWTLVIRDVTQERATQKQIRQQEQMAAVGQLAAGIAHDFNNILTSIIGFSELLLAEPDIPAYAQKDLGKIVKQGKRAARLVSQILDFSRQSITERRPLDLVEFLSETLRLLERTLPETIEIVLDIESRDETYIVDADWTQLQQGLTNLAVNARDAMPVGGKLQFRLRTVEFTADNYPSTGIIPPGKWIALSVSDNGEGIPSETLPNIFQPFFTTKEVGHGTGLGLAQVYGIVKQHEGNIDVNSEVGQGTNFNLYLPASTTPYQTTLAAQFEEIPTGDKEVILLVEDDVDVLDVAKAMLKRLNYHPLAATDGEEALKVFKQYSNKISLVLTDLTMPKMGGVTLSLALQELKPAVRVVVMTGYPLKGSAKALLSQGVIEWIHKPLSIRQLAYLVNRLLSVKPKKSLIE